MNRPQIFFNPSKSPNYSLLDCNESQLSLNPGSDWAPSRLTFNQHILLVTVLSVIDPGGGEWKDASLSPPDQRLYREKPKFQPWFVQNRLKLSKIMGYPPPLCISGSSPVCFVLKFKNCFIWFLEKTSLFAPHLIRPIHLLVTCNLVAVQRSSASFHNGI